MVYYVDSMLSVATKRGLNFILWIGYTIRKMLKMWNVLISSIFLKVKTEPYTYSLYLIRIWLWLTIDKQTDTRVYTVILYDIIKVLWTVLSLYPSWHTIIYCILNYNDIILSAFCWKWTPQHGSFIHSIIIYRHY